MKDNYQQQASDFLAKHGITFSAKLSNSKRAPWNDSLRGGGSYQFRTVDYRNHFVVTFKRGRRSISFDFFDSISNFKAGIKELDAYSALSCCSSEFYCPETYHDYLSDFGAEDCKEQKKTYNAWKKQSAKLQKFFGTKEVREDLLKIC